MIIMKYIFLLTLTLLACANPAIAGNFADTSEAIVDGLLAPKASLPTSRTRSLSPRTRSLAPQSQQTRTIKRQRRKGGKTVVETATVPAKRDQGFVNLKILFDVNSHHLRGESIPLLDELGKALVDPRLEDKTIIINGHTDTDGTDDYNLDLSYRRAATVKNYIVANHQVAKQRLRVMGYGESLPIVVNDSRANKQQNRRVEITMMK